MQDPQKVHFGGLRLTFSVSSQESIVDLTPGLSPDDEIRPRDVGLKKETPAACLVDSAFQELPYKEAKEQTLQSFNTNYINNLLTESNGNVTRAAKICGLERQALQQVMRRYGIKADPFRT